METAKKAKWLGLFGIALCGLCCTVPIIGTVIGLSLTSVVFYLEKTGIVTFGLSMVILLYAWYKRTSAKNKVKVCSCSTACECKAQNIAAK